MQLSYLMNLHTSANLLFCIFELMDRVTAIVATHERQKALSEMVDSFHQYYPQLKIIAVDSSREVNVRNDIVHILDADNPGISVKRNKALSQVSTPLFLLLDDDYICTDQTDIQKLIARIQQGNTIVWGQIHNVWSEQYDFHGYYTIMRDTLYHFVDRKNPVTQRYDTMFNFFVWKTDTIRAIGWWDEKLQYAREHDDFFLTMKQKKLPVAYEESVVVDHENYEKHHGRENSRWSIQHFLSKWDIKNKIEIRLIKNTPNSYISYHNCIIKTQVIPEDIKESIQSTYGHYPIIIS